MGSLCPAALVMLPMLLEWVLGQRAPCYECEVYKDLHPQSKPYEEIRSHCSYPCECPDRGPSCPPGVSIVRDGCGCCPICARQRGEPCDGTTLCDEKRGLVCNYPNEADTKGTCTVIKGLPCTVFNRTYDNGETFLLDCRTQCACQNGTYACASLCPQEYISPQGTCRHPRLVEVPGQCCREWMCDSATGFLNFSEIKSLAAECPPLTQRTILQSRRAQHPPDCRQEFSSWSLCSSVCGLGLSHRVSNVNPLCIPTNESRLCQLRSCDEGFSSLMGPQHARHHHLRKGHECKATQRVSTPVRYKFGTCRSRRRYRPKFCGRCAGSGVCCRPQLSTTIRVEFHCDQSSRLYTEGEREMLLDLAEPGNDLWWPDVEQNLIMKTKNTNTQPNTYYFSVEWILKCFCSDTCDDDSIIDTTARPTNTDGEVILHRVHRTAAP